MTQLKKKSSQFVNIISGCIFLYLLLLSSCTNHLAFLQTPINVYQDTKLMLEIAVFQPTNSDNQVIQRSRGINTLSESVQIDIWDDQGEVVAQGIELQKIHGTFRGSVQIPHFGQYTFRALGYTEPSFGGLNNFRGTVEQIIDPGTLASGVTILTSWVNNQYAHLSSMEFDQLITTSNSVPVTKTSQGLQVQFGSGGWNDWVVLHQPMEVNSSSDLRLFLDQGFNNENDSIMVLFSVSSTKAWNDPSNRGAAIEIVRQGGDFRVWARDNNGVNWTMPQTFSGPVISSSNPALQRNENGHLAAISLGVEHQNGSLYIRVNGVRLKLDERFDPGMYSPNQQVTVKVVNQSGPDKTFTIQSVHNHLYAQVPEVNLELPPVLVQGSSTAMLDGSLTYSQTAALEHFDWTLSDGRTFTGPTINPFLSTGGPSSLELIVTDTEGRISFLHKALTIEGHYGIAVESADDMPWFDFSAYTPNPYYGQQQPGGRTFYLSTSGDDENDGTSPETPWRSFARVTEFSRSPGLEPGDSILLRRGDVWVNETFMVDGRDQWGYYRYENGSVVGTFADGTRENNIRIGAYGPTGASRPVIRQENEIQVNMFLPDVSFYIIEDLEFRGGKAGIYLYANVGVYYGPGYQFTRQGIEIRNSHFEDIANTNILWYHYDDYDISQWNPRIYDINQDGDNTNDFIGDFNAGGLFFNTGIFLGGTTPMGGELTTQHVNAFKDIHIHGTTFRNCDNGITHTFYWFQHEDPIVAENIVIRNSESWETLSGLVNLFHVWGAYINNVHSHSTKGYAASGISSGLLYFSHNIIIDNSSFNGAVRDRWTHPHTGVEHQPHDGVGLDFEGGASNVLVRNSNFIGNAGSGAMLLNTAPFESYDFTTSPPTTRLPNRNIFFENCLFENNVWDPDSNYDPTRTGITDVQFQNSQPGSSLYFRNVEFRHSDRGSGIFNNVNPAGTFFYNLIAN